MSRTELQLIALISMLLDHIAIVAYRAGWLVSDNYVIMRAVGRLAYPLFAFMVSEGLHKTGNPKAYLKRLLVFSAVSQLPYMFFKARGGIPSFDLREIHLNMICSYTLVAAFIFSVKRYTIMSERERAEFAFVPIAATMLVFFLGDRCEYGLLGVAFVCCLFFAYPIRWMQCLIIAVWAVLKYADAQTSLVGALLAAAFVLLYNGQIGEKRFPKYFLYWFYPTHLTVFSMIMRFYKTF